MDVDTGVDDAFALLFAALHDGVDLRGVTCVDGNVDVDQVVANTLQVLNTAGAASVPVARGAERPLLNESMYARDYHGQDGLGDLGLGPAPTGPVSLHAVDFLQKTLSESLRPLVIVALAPLTNLALLLRMYPRIESQIERIVLMGGSIGSGNATPLAEFNVWHDPESAAIVMNADTPKTMYGLDVFYDVTVTAEQGIALAAMEHPAAKLGGLLISHQVRAMAAREEPELPVTLGDYGALAALLDPDGATIESATVSVVTTSGPARGQTVVDLGADMPAGVGDEGAAVDVVTKVDGHRYSTMWLEAFGLSGTAHA